MSNELVVPSTEEQQRLGTAWAAVCEKIGQSPNSFPLRFGQHWDWTYSIFRCRDGWSVLDVYRGEELSRRFIESEELLLYDLAKWMTAALAGWHREKNMPPISKLLEAAYHWLDPRLDLRLQLRQHRRLNHKYQCALMAKISPAWEQRLRSEFREELQSSRSGCGAQDSRHGR